MFSFRGRRVTLAVLGWMAAAAGSVAVGLIAVSFLSSGLADDGTARPLTGSEVLRALDKTTNSPQPTPADTPTPTDPPSTPDEPDPSKHTPTGKQPVVSKFRGLSSQGGTVTARCVDGEPEIRGWSPNPGYEADDDSGNEDQVKFEPDDDDTNPTVRLRVECEGNRPVGHPELEYDD